MIIVHFILGRANPDSANGVNKVISGLAKYGNRRGESVRVIGLSKSQKEPYQKIERDGLSVESYNDFFNGALPRLKVEVAECDVVHLHSVWNHYNLVIARYLRKIGKPYVVTAHSGLSDDRIRQSKYLFKLAYHKLFQKRLFDAAAGVHALTREESTVLRKYTDNSNIFVVSNGQDIENLSLVAKSYTDRNAPLKFGYLGRLTVEKNIDGLIVAISRLERDIRESISVSLIGPLGKESKRLKELSVELGVSECVHFIGPLYGQSKAEALKNLDFYIHPAHSDVVSIAVMEAFSYGLPSVITRTSDVAYYYDTGAFIMVEPDSKDICRGIVELLKRTSQWEEMSDKAIVLTRTEFNWEVVAEKLQTEYKKLLGGGRG